MQLINNQETVSGEMQRCAESCGPQRSCLEAAETAGKLSCEDRMKQNADGEMT